MYGREFSDISIAYEDLVSNTDAVVQRLLDTVGWTSSGPVAVATSVNRDSVEKWRQLADDTWFKAHELAAERILRSHLGGLA